MVAVALRQANYRFMTKFAALFLSGQPRRRTGVEESRRNTMQRFLANRSVAKMLRNASSFRRPVAMDSSSMMPPALCRRLSACGARALILWSLGSLLVALGGLPAASSGPSWSATASCPAQRGRPCGSDARPPRRPFEADPPSRHCHAGNCLSNVRRRYTHGPRGKSVTRDAGSRPRSFATRSGCASGLSSACATSRTCSRNAGSRSPTRLSDAG